MPPKVKPKTKKKARAGVADRPDVSDSGSDSDDLPVRLPNCCDIDFTTMAAHLLDIFVVTTKATPAKRSQNLCEKCGWKVSEHKISPKAPSIATSSPPSAVTAAPAPAQAPANDKQVVVSPGPKASLALTAESPLTFLGVIQAWKNATWCVDDSDVVQSRLEEISAAWVRGVYGIVSKFFVVTGSADDIHRTFKYKPVPEDVSDSVVFRQERGTAVLGCLTLANAVLDIAVAYARRRCVIDKVANPVATIEELRTDEWYALIEARKGRPAIRTGELEPDEEEFEGPNKVLWWFLFLASLSTLVMQSRLERAVRDYGASYRAKHAEAFKPRAIWSAKYSAAAVAAARAALRPPPPPADHQKRPREASAPPMSLASAAGIAGSPGTVASKRAEKRKRWLDRKAAARVSEVAAGAGAAAAGAGDADSEDAASHVARPLFKRQQPPAVARTRTATTLPSVYGTSANPGGGPGGGRGRGGRGRGRGRH